MFDEIDKDSLIQEEFIDEINIEGVEEADNIISQLIMYSDNEEMLTKLYTDILMSDNVIYIMTRVSQNSIFSQHFPELYVDNEMNENFINCQQNSKYHRYGVFKHTMYTVEIVGKENIQRTNLELKLLKWAMFLHDIGKPYVKTIIDSDRESFEGHDDKSAELAEVILNRFVFSEFEKKIIVKVIKYHDKYLNEGDLTFDNLSFLAKELDDKKDLFYLLLDVKIADSKAKTIDIYNKFMTVVPKYYDFANQYFANVDMKANDFMESNTNSFEDIICGNLDKDIIKDDKNSDALILDSNISLENNNINQELTKEELDEIYGQIIDKVGVYPIYQTIIDLKEKQVYGYDSFSRIIHRKNISIIEVIKKAKNYEKYDKLQQSLFINAIDTFSEIKFKDVNRLFMSIDIKSYEKYINKPKIYDFMRAYKLVLELDNYDGMYTGDMQKIVDNIKEKGGEVLLNNFGTSTFTLNDLDTLKIDYIKYDLTLLKEFEESRSNQKYLSELATYCLAKNIKLIVTHIENIEQLLKVKSLGVNYVEGFLFGLPTTNIENMSDYIKTALNDASSESIV